MHWHIYLTINMPVHTFENKKFAIQNKNMQWHKKMRFLTMLIHKPINFNKLIKWFLF